MGWEMSTLQGRDGALRNLLRGRGEGLEARCDEFWAWLPEPKPERALAIARRSGFQSDGPDVVRDVLTLMLKEHDGYRAGIEGCWGTCDAAEDQGEAMMIDNREMMAEHLAARRAEARLNLLVVPRHWEPTSEAWMQLPLQRDEMPSLEEVSGSVTDEAFRLKNWEKHRGGPDKVQPPYPHADEYGDRDGKAFTRADVFADFQTSTEKGVISTIEKGVISTIKWGYPKGGRPGGAWHAFSDAFRQASQYAQAINALGTSPHPAETVLTTLNRIVPGVGTATTSKIAYFAKLAANEGACLIYDSMVRRAIVASSDPAFGDLRSVLEGSKNDITPQAQEKTYGLYLTSVGMVATRLGVTPPQVELALFRIGRMLPARGKE